MANNNDYEYDAYFGGGDGGSSFDFNYDVEAQPGGFYGDMGSLLDNFNYDVESQLGGFYGDMSSLLDNFNYDVESQDGGFYGDIYGLLSGEDYNYDVEAQPGGFYGDLIDAVSGGDYNYDVESQDGGFYGNIFGPDYSVQTDPLSGLVERFDTSGNFLETLNAPSNLGDVESQLGGFYGDTSGAQYDPQAGLTTIDRGDQGTQYITDDGYDVNYRADGTIEIRRPDGSIGYYSQDAEKGYYAQYEDPNTEGALVSTYARDISGEGPTRGVFYSGTGPDVAVADYQDVFGAIDSPVKVTTLEGKDLKPTTTTYGGGKTKTTPVNDTRTIIQKIVDTIKDATPGGKTGPTSNKDALQTLMMLLGGLYGLYQGNKQKPSTYGGGIPKYTAQRNLGKGVTYTKAAQGGLMDVTANQPNQNVMMMANGGLTSLAAGRYLRGRTDGMADKLDADIDGKQPAKLSHGEFVIPADVVSHLGNGNSDAGADVLYGMMAKVRKARTGNSKQGKEINPRKYLPA